VRRKSSIPTTSITASTCSRGGSCCCGNVREFRRPRWQRGEGGQVQASRRNGNIFVGAKRTTTTRDVYGNVIAANIIDIGIIRATAAAGPLVARVGVTAPRAATTLTAPLVIRHGPTVLCHGGINGGDHTTEQ
jgi:hypothetical protein